jgi:hypothetical protein
MIEQQLKRYCTERQLEILEACIAEGSMRKAALKLGVHKNAVNNAMAAIKRKAALQGYSPEHDLQHPVPDGFKLKGASTLYDAKTGEAKIQWVKSEVDKERQEEIFREALAAMADSLPRVEAIAPPEVVLQNLAACYPIGDLHLGLYSWIEECGGNYDLEIASNLLKSAIDSLVQSSPGCGTAFLAILGDFLHYDSFEAVTPAHKNLLDADGRYPKVVRAAIKLVRYMIYRCLEKHLKVHLVVAIGNHDPSSSIFLAECLQAIYEDESRVTIDSSPGHYHYWRFGKNLVGIHHGDKAKQERLPMLMAVDRPLDWGETEHRFYWTGHTHHQSVKDIMGVSCESFRILPPLDAYAAGAGYRSIRDMKAIILHQDFGEVARYSVNPKMMEK